MGKLKVHELRTKNKTDLQKQLEELKTELAALRVAKVTGGAASKLSKIKVVRKSIARVLTVIDQTQKAQLRIFYKDKARAAAASPRAARPPPPTAGGRPSRRAPRRRPRRRTTSRSTCGRSRPAPSATPSRRARRRSKRRRRRSARSTSRSASMR